MKFKPLAIVCAVAAMATSAHAQVGTSITLTGSMSVSEGGTGKASGHVFQDAMGVFGSVAFGFTAGELVSLRLNQISDYSVPGSTAFFGGPTVATFRINGQIVQIPGKVFVMVDDLDIDNFPFPDQVFLRFDSNDGTRTVIRHGKMVRGDVTIVP